MNKETLLEEVRKVELALNLAERYDDIDYYLADSVWHLIDCINKLDEPQKPIIPQFVADWIETSRYAEYHLLGAVYDGSYSEDMKEWLFRGDKRTRQDNQDKLTRAWLDGYEVEKEKLYNVVNKENYFMLRKYDGLVDTMQLSTTMSRDEFGKDTRFMLTEKEIKDYDERFWAFAEPV